MRQNQSQGNETESEEEEGEKKNSIGLQSELLRKKKFQGQLQG
jgi:hypothetical protein